MWYGKPGYSGHENTVCRQTAETEFLSLVHTENTAETQNIAQLYAVTRLNVQAPSPTVPQ